MQNDDVLFQKLSEGLAAKGIAVNLPPPPEPESRDLPTRMAARPGREEPPNTYEQAILTLMEIRDLHIQTFRLFSNQKDVASAMTVCIRKVEQSIQSLGGSIDAFNPLSELSGLAKAPAAVGEQAMLSNALKVAENTKKEYGLYEISKMMVKLIKGRPSVLLQVQGKEGDCPFVVNGQVVSKTDFTGNEIIDYVRDGDQQLFSVRIRRLGQMVNVSDDFIIRYKDVSNEPAPPAE